MAASTTLNKPPVALKNGHMTPGQWKNLEKLLMRTEKTEGLSKNRKPKVERKIV